MSTCPVCENELNTFLCLGCGFDLSRDYEHYPTVSPVLTAGAVSVRKKKEIFALHRRMKDQTAEKLLHCPMCGGTLFSILVEEIACTCQLCGNKISKADFLPCFNPYGFFAESRTPEPDFVPKIKTAKQYVGTVSAGCYHTVGLRSDGTVASAGTNEDKQCAVSQWKDVVAISAGWYHTVGLKADGTVVAAGLDGSCQCDVRGWKNIVSVSAGYQHTVGLRSDGTVIATGGNTTGQCNVDGWRNILSISAGRYHTVGLKADGNVVAVGLDSKELSDIDGWKDIVAISAGESFTAGLKSNGTVVTVGLGDEAQNEVKTWENIVAISVGTDHMIGLKSDGTVVAAGYNSFEQCNVNEWQNIVALDAGVRHTVGLKADGTVVAVGYNNKGQCDVKRWCNIASPQPQRASSSAKVAKKPDNLTSSDSEHFNRYIGRLASVVLQIAALKTANKAEADRVANKTESKFIHQRGTPGKTGEYTRESRKRSLVTAEKLIKPLKWDYAEDPLNLVIRYKNFRRAVIRYNGGGKALKVPDSVVEICEHAFSDCPTLESVLLPNSIKYIRKFAFAECTSLKAITIPKGIVSIEDNTFFHCTGLTEICLPHGLLSIGVHAFAGCSSLKKITIPDTVLNISSTAFVDCWNIWIAATGKWIDEHAFILDQIRRHTSIRIQRI